MSSGMSIEVTQSGPTVLEVYTGTVQQKVFVGPFANENLPNLLTVPGMIWQTGLGPNGQGMTLWIEDGV